MTKHVVTREGKPDQYIDPDLARAQSEQAVRDWDRKAKAKAEEDRLRSIPRIAPGSLHPLFGQRICKKCRGTGGNQIGACPRCYGRGVEAA